MFTRITGKEAVDFLINKHYSGRKPIVTHAFGMFDGDKLVAVCTFGTPASPWLCRGVCGPEFTSHVIELNRLCRLDSVTQPLSKFVAWCLKQLKSEDKIVVSFSDTAMHHSGYIYQACNFIYTGKTRERTDKYTEGNKHCRHYDNDNQNGLRKVRTAKHRYIYFCTKRPSLLKLWWHCLKYAPQPYPKEQNKNYTLGEFLLPDVVQDKRISHE